LNIIVNDLIKVIIRSLLQYGNILNIDLASKLINFGVNDVLVFQGVKLEMWDEFEDFLVILICKCREISFPTL